MQYWLLKSEPGAWSWDDQVRKGVEPWTGVRNYQARNNLRAMKLGDLAFFYHSVEEKRIVGIVKVVRPAYPDPTDDTGKWDVVDVQAVTAVAEPVTLDQMRREPLLSELKLLKQSRLSVVPVTAGEWKLLLKLAKVGKLPATA